MRDYRRASEKLNAMYKAYADEDYKQTQADYKALLKEAAFRRVLAGILKKGRVFGSIAFDSNETNEVFKTLGWRELAVDIYHTANAADGEAVAKAIAERNEVERERRERFEREQNQNNEMKGTNE